MSEKQRGALCMMAAGLLFSIGGLFIKLIPWSPLAVNGARAMIAMWITLLFMRATKHRLVVNPSVLLGGAALVATNILFVAANKLTTAANTIVLQFSAPIFLIFIMWIFFHEKPDRLDVVTCAVVLCGIVCFFVDSLSAGGTLGNILALCAGFTFSGVFLVGTFPGSDSLSAVFFGQLAGAVTGLPWLLQEADFSAPVLIDVFVLGIFQLGLAYVFFAVGLRTTPPVVACLLTGVEPVCNPIWVALFYGETITPLSLTGAVVVIGS
ncbi:MAG TPA: DMT family transporter, partial [Oscillospiraceae bacterium]|nr:DMT family transporter [Oscillospiraceae bacterium]